MKYQAKKQKQASQNRLLREEAEHHDDIYDSAYPFHGDSLRIDEERVSNIYDSSYKPGTLKHGRRKRRMIELLDIDNIRGRSVLDVGCGNGQHSVYLAMYGADVFGFDISRKGVQMARQVAEANGVSDQCDFSVQSASDLPYPSQEFDVVLCSAVLHHIWKYDGAKDELYRVLREGGALVFDEGMRSNPVYNFCRDAYRKLTGQTQDLGDIDLEYEDLISYGDRFSKTYLEFHTLFSGIKNLIADDFDNPRHTRLLIRCCAAVDEILESIDMLDPYCLDVVGRFEK